MMNTENVIPKNTPINMVVHWKELSSKINCFLHSLVAQKISHDWEVNSSSLKVCYAKSSFLSSKRDKPEYVPHLEQTATV